MSHFRAAVDRVLRSWTVLQLAVQHGFGGPDCTAKAHWMSDAVDQWLQENSNVETYEVEDLLADILSTEFDTVADDGSLPEIAREICGCFRLYKDGKVAELQEHLSHLPAASVDRCQRVVGDDDEDDDVEVNNQPVTNDHGESQQVNSLDTEVSETNSDKREQGETPMDTGDGEEDGWTVVRKGKRR